MREEQLAQRLDLRASPRGRLACRRIHVLQPGEAIERAAQAEELRRRFGEDAAAAERETLKSGKAYDAREVFAYLEARSRGKRVSRPRAAPWRRSG